MADITTVPNLCTYKTLQKFHRHEKGWGYELWIENIPEYCGKLLHFNKGKKCSMHYHMEKLETMYVQSGMINMKLIDPEDGHKYVIRLEQGDSFKIPRGQAHQIIASEDSDIFEFSTQHFEYDSYRIEKGD